MRSPKALTVAVAAAALAAPAAASADSIVYLDGGNVVSASPDGAKKVQLTDQGDWFSVTQADDGTIAAARTTGSIEVLARDGRPLRSISTQPTRTGNGGWHRGAPINLAFSPDGRTIAYEYFDVTCPPASSCPSEQHSVMYTSADGPAATPVDTYGQQFGRHDPSFVSNGRALLFGGAGAGVNLDDLGGGESSDTLWFTRDTDFSDGEVSRDGTRLALNVGYGDDTRIGWLVVRGNPATGVPADPSTDDTVCESDADAKLGGATWSPDGSATAYESRDGIEIVRFSAFAPGNCGVAGQSVLSATGSEPDWGPADPPAARFTPGDGTTTPPPVTLDPPAATPLALSAPRKVTAAALRRGMKVEVTAPAAGTVKVKATVGGRKVATGRTTARAAGPVTVRLGRVAPRAASRLRGKRLKLVVTAAGAKASRSVGVR